MIQSVSYLHIEPGARIPKACLAEPAGFVLILEAAVDPGWQAALSDWIVDSGCLYMMAWGMECSSWDDSVDWANLEKFVFGEIPCDRSVVTTWHDDQPLEEAFWFAKNTATHPVVELERTLLLHISATERRDELMQAFFET